MMNRVLLKNIKTIAALTLFAVVPRLQAQDKDAHVVVISLDGFAAYNLEDEKLPIPTLRGLMAEGAWAKRMEAVNPTVTWPNHTTMVTGLFPRDHGLLYNGTLVRSSNPPGVKIDPSVDKTAMVHATTVYDVASGKGQTTAQVDWVAINDAPTINWAFPERAKASDPLVAEMISKGVIKAEDVSASGNPTIVWKDQTWTKAGAYILREHKPNLLLFHLLTLDSTQHNYSPRTLAAYDAIALLDHCVAQLVEATRQAGIYEKTTFLIVSDHGFKPVSQLIHVKAMLAKAQLAPGVEGVPEGGSAMFYIDKDREKELLPKLQMFLAGTDGVARLATPADYATLGLPAQDKDPQSPSAVAFAKSGYAFSGGKDNDSVITPVKPATGSHGYLNTDPEMDAIFIAAGRGIRRGVVIERTTNRQVAPTIARLLGIELPRTEESAPAEIFR